MRALVTGDRNWNCREVCDLAMRLLPADAQVVHGDAQGADRQAGEAASHLGLDVVAVPAEWVAYGRAAGPIRNRKMLDMEPDVVFCFHDDLTNSKGTRDCVREATKRGIPVLYFSTDLLHS